MKYDVFLRKDVCQLNYHTWSRCIAIRIISIDIANFQCQLRTAKRYVVDSSYAILTHLSTYAVTLHCSVYKTQNACICADAYTNMRCIVNY